MLAVALILAGTSWTAVDGSQTLAFQQGKMGGHGGCNGYGAAYHQKGSALRFGPIMATRMACAPAVMRGEQRWFERLDAVRRADVSRGQLVLRNAAGQVVLRLKRQP